MKRYLMITFNSEILGSNTIIDLSDDIPYGIKNNLESFLEQRRGRIVTPTNFYIGRKLSEKMLHALFKEFKFPFVSKAFKEVAKTSEINLSKELIQMYRIIKFGKYKNKEISEVPSDYLIWLKNNHSDSVFLTIIEEELKDREELDRIFI